MLCLVRSIRWIVFYQDGAPSMGVLSRKNIHSTTSLNFSALLAVSRIIRYVVISIGVSVRRYWIQIPSSAKRIFPFRITFKYSQFSSNESCEKCFSSVICDRNSPSMKIRAQRWAKTQNMWIERGLTRSQSLPRRARRDQTGTRRRRGHRYRSQERRIPSTIRNLKGSFRMKVIGRAAYYLHSRKPRMLNKLFATSTR